jgi:cytidylate kinase
LILGRGAFKILRNSRKTVKIGIFCELELRIKKYAKRNKISIEESRIKIDSYDSAKKNYYLNVFQKEPLDPSMFSLMFNTATLSDSEIIEDICAAAKKYVVKSKDNGKKS